MTEFVPGTHPDFDTDSDGRAVAFRDRGGQHHGLVTTAGGAGGITSVMQMTQAQYDALPAKNAATLYVIMG